MPESKTAKARSRRGTKKTLASSMSLDAAPRLGDRVLNVRADPPDLRDRIYEPALVDLKLTMIPEKEKIGPILDQGKEGACTGFALASAITQMSLKRRGENGCETTTWMASARMLYEMAKIHDEWPGEDYEGSSIRGALKGFYNNGVCSEDVAPYEDGDKDWYLKIDHVRDARTTGLGAYYRLRPEMVDYHAALNQAEVIYVSAMIHRGWQNPRDGQIKPSHLSEGGHAFIIVGYDEKGFLIQNSWGEDWGGFAGKPGIAHWLYEDWAANVMDAWVLRLSVPTPEAFDLTITEPSPESQPLFEAQRIVEPRYESIIGHVIHLNDGKLVGTGKYPTPLTTIRETASYLGDESETDQRGYKHLMFYAHGGLNNQSASANRIRKMKPVFKRNGIYPIHFMWETGFFESLKDVVLNSKTKAEARVGGVRDFFDRMLEGLARPAGTAIWRDMKWDAAQSFKGQGGGRQALKILLEANANRDTPLKVHLVGHSAGAILLARLLESMKRINPSDTPIQTCSLMAPACTIELFNKVYEPRIGQTEQKDGIRKLRQYNLVDQRELDDTVGPYGKSLLYLVSNAFEDEKMMPLLGLDKFKSGVPSKAGYKVHYAGRAPTITDSRTHGGFDNDRRTMNDVLKNILGRKPTLAKAFQPEDLNGY